MGRAPLKNRSLTLGYKYSLQLIIIILKHHNWLKAHSLNVVALYKVAFQNHVTLGSYLVALINYIGLLITKNHLKIKHEGFWLLIKGPK